MSHPVLMYYGSQPRTVFPKWQIWAIDQTRHRDGAAILGFSMGGMVAMEIARKTPQLVKKLALLNTNFHADLNDRKAAREKNLELAKLTGMENVIRHSYLESYLHKPTKGAEDLIVKMACELGMLQDCGHFSILEQPDMVNDALRKWYLES
jgi:pimeloyl-ACP methyl ester carboxylesterase